MNDNIIAHHHNVVEVDFTRSHPFRLACLYSEGDIYGAILNGKVGESSSRRLGTPHDSKATQAKIREQSNKQTKDNYRLNKGGRQ